MKKHDGVHAKSPDRFEDKNGPVNQHTVNQRTDNTNGQKKKKNYELPNTTKKTYEGTTQAPRKQG